jgi:hypothetical protein
VVLVGKVEPLRIEREIEEAIGLPGFPGLARSRRNPGRGIAGRIGCIGCVADHLEKVGRQFPFDVSRHGIDREPIVQRFRDLLQHPYDSRMDFRDSCHDAFHCE